MTLGVEGKEISRIKLLYLEKMTKCYENKDKKDVIVLIASNHFILIIS